MHETGVTGSFRRIAVAVAFASLLPACESTGNWLKGRRTATPDDPVVLGAPATNTYLSEMYALVSGDPATQAEIYADARAAAQLTPDPTTRLRYALVLATPGHAETNEQEAQTLLRDILAQPELLTVAEISLANVQLRDVEQRIVLRAEANRLRSENARAATTESRAIEQRIQTVEAENRRLRDSLAEAEAKLEAITSIERSVRQPPEDQQPED